MKHSQWLYLAGPALIALLFWNSLLGACGIAAWSFCFLYTRGLFRLGWKRLVRPNTAAVEAMPEPNMTEPTMITLVNRAPHQLLGVEQNAGTSTIFHSFYQRVKEEQGDNLKLSRQGRRLSAAKNAMLAKRRKGAAQAQDDVNRSLAELLETRPPFAGKVLQFRNLTSTALEQFRVGAEIEGSGIRAVRENIDGSGGRGSSRLVIESRSGRLLGGAESPEVAFLPGTRFLIVSRSPWKNPHDPDSGPGFTFELVEVA